MTTTAIEPHRCVTEVDPDARYPVPDVMGDFVHHDGLERLAWAIIDAKLPDFPRDDATFDFLWKRKGGTTKGNYTFGKAIKTSGLAAFYSQTDFVIWLAADHMKAFDFTNYQVEAVLYHELLHIAVEEELDEDTGEIVRTVVLKGHDFEGFRKEVQEYGLYRPHVREMASAFQPHLI